MLTAFPTAASPRFQLGRKMHSLAIADCSMSVWTWLEQNVGDEKMNKKKYIQGFYQIISRKSFHSKTWRKQAVCGSLMNTHALVTGKYCSWVLVAAAKGISVWLVQKMPQFQCLANSQLKTSMFAKPDQVLFKEHTMKLVSPFGVFCGTQ